MNAAAGTWPEQNAVDAWLQKHGIDVDFKTAMELKNATTAFRIVQQERAEKAEAALAAIRPETQAHTDHPLRHYDRTCPACVAENNAEGPRGQTPDNSDGQGKPEAAPAAPATPRTARPVMSEGNLSGWSVYVTSLERYADQLERELAEKEAERAKQHRAACDATSEAIHWRNVAQGRSPFAPVSASGSLPADEVIRALRELADGYFRDPLGNKFELSALGRTRREAIIAQALASRSTSGTLPLDPTPAMIEAGAQRLVRWEDGCKWPDSWSSMDVRAARNDAERCWRSMWLEATGSAKQPRDDSAPLSTTHA